MTSRSRKPRLYLAGKISRSGWRDDLLNGRCGYSQSRANFAVDARGEALHVRDPYHEVDCGDFAYVGPFFEDFGHGAAHGPGTHGAIAEYPLEEELATVSVKERSDAIAALKALRAFVFNANMSAIERADAIFAYVDELDCFGTLVELGHAFALAKPIFICLGPSLSEAEKGDLWFALEAATMVSEWPVDVAFRGLIKSIAAGALGQFGGRA
ncbi:nucleoside 2-deoxyribosyltransferase [Methylocystis sp. L43]|uniref:nucleoside 2-deoxyribosyltransferase n=1 Tax=unclassified Methylocystis TaxID=2625913 RepID=UPI0018C27481|nr:MULTISPECIES: nucleoside 2-deoxyribosyltransferase [unclassified Methylocystis]MBG0797561.1 nucleoside 2-deoxyribosyltransferase [Methylocystis sp. L43]MBG0805165.1 nucleoside 2-deoxyribosyltransferase [Methylocystis sp. H15]